MDEVSGKNLMNIRVVKADGSTPGISSYLLRWLLFPIDSLLTGGFGLLVVLLTKNSQRMGDLAAGTMVIKETNYRKIHVSLDEFDYLTKDYQSHLSTSSRFVAGTNKCYYPDIAGRQERPCAPHCTIGKESPGTSYYNSP